MNKLKAILISFVLAIMVAVLTPVSAQATQGYCGINWGSLEKVQADTSRPDDFIYNIRSGRHGCFDRLVIDMGRASGYRGYDVRYVSQVTQDGSGYPVPLRGAADIQIIVYAPNHDQNYNVTYDPARDSEAVNVSGYSTFRQVAWAGAFEGQSTVGLGVRARLPMRAFVLNDGQNARLVIDVAHRWS